MCKVMILTLSQIYQEESSVFCYHDKWNLLSVSDADREIPTQENEVYRLSGVIRSPSGWDFSVCIGD